MSTQITKLVNSTITNTRSLEAARNVAALDYKRAAALGADVFIEYVAALSDSIGTDAGIVTSEEVAKRDAALAADTGNEPAAVAARRNKAKQAINALFTLERGLNRALADLEQPYKVSVSNKGGMRPALSVKNVTAPARVETLVLTAKTDPAKIAESSIFASMEPATLAALATAVNAALHNLPAVEG